jgi:ABC-2 type transport system permease protein
MAPFISMGLYTRERRQGTLELLATYPVSGAGVLMGKYLAAVCIFLITLALSSVTMGVLSFMTSTDPG